MSSHVPKTPDNSHCPQDAMTGIRLSRTIVIGECIVDNNRPHRSTAPLYCGMRLRIDRKLGCRPPMLRTWNDDIAVV